MKGKPRFSPEQVLGRKTAAQRIAAYLSFPDGNRVEHFCGMLSGLLFCGAMRGDQYARMSDNLLDVAYPGRREAREKSGVGT